MNQIERLVKIYLDSRARILKEIEKRELWKRNAEHQKRILREIDRELERLNLESFAWADEAVKEAYMKGAKLAWMAAQEADRAVRAFSAFGGIHTKAVKLLAHNAQDYLSITNNLIARQAKDTVRQIGVEVTAKKFAETLTVRETKKLLEQRLQEENFFSVPWRNGKGSMRVDSYAELVARTTTREAQQTGIFNQAEEMGHHLYKMTSHSTTCKVCASRQGRVYRSVDFPEGDPRQRFPHISEGFPRWPTYKTVHPNCGHSAHAFIWDQKTEAEQQAALSRAAEPFNHDPRGEAERLRYEKAQRANRERLRDRKEWEKIKKIMPDEAPTFSGYRNMRKSDSERYNDLRYAVKVNDKLAAGNVDYTAKEWYNKHQETKAALIGTQTASGVKVSGVAHHITDRILERKVSLSDIMQSLQSPYKVSDVITDSQGRHSIRYFGENCYTAVNPDTGNAVTVIDKPRSKKKGGP